MGSCPPGWPCPAPLGRCQTCALHRLVWVPGGQVWSTGIGQTVAEQQEGCGLSAKIPCGGPTGTSHERKAQAPLHLSTSWPRTCTLPPKTVAVSTGTRQGGSWSQGVSTTSPRRATNSNASVKEGKSVPQPPKPEQPIGCRTQQTVASCSGNRKLCVTSHFGFRHAAKLSASL